VDGLGVTGSRDPSALMAPVEFLHPRANRAIRLGEEFVVAYTFTRAPRRTIGLRIGPDGLSVRAPRWAAVRDVEALLHTKTGWIMQQLGQWRERQAQQAAQRGAWRDGMPLPYLGRTLVLECAAWPEPESGVPDGAALEGTAERLCLNLPPDATPTQVRERTRAWLMMQARPLFESRLEHFASRVGVHGWQLGLSNAATRWGSARANGAIRLNWKLIHFPLAVIDYVVVHELCHLQVMDHSPRFWAAVGAVVPEYVTLRRQLKTTTCPCWD